MVEVWETGALDKYRYLVVRSTDLYQTYLSILVRLHYNRATYYHGVRLAYANNLQEFIFIGNTERGNLNKIKYRKKYARTIAFTMKYNSFVRIILVWYLNQFITWLVHCLSEVFYVRVREKGQITFIPTVISIGKQQTNCHNYGENNWQFVNRLEDYNQY